MRFFFFGAEDISVVARNNSTNKITAGKRCFDIVIGLRWTCVFCFCFCVCFFFFFGKACNRWIKKKCCHKFLLCVCVCVCVCVFCCNLFLWAKKKKEKKNTVVPSSFLLPLSSPLQRPSPLWPAQHQQLPLCSIFCQLQIIFS